MKQGLLQSSRYSPGNMDRESLEALFVGRRDVMGDVLSRVTTSMQSPEKHYILLVGPRGSGKTHLLALAYHRLIDQLDKDNARNSVAVAVLNEEEWGVASYLDLVVRILRALVDEAPELDTGIAEVYDRFSKDPADAEAFAVALLRQHTRGKTLLLLCENLVDLFDGLNDEGQKRWRATIQEDGNWAIVATTPSLFAALTLQDNPFYGFFTIRQLEAIDLDTGIELLARKAVHEGSAELANFLRTPLGRARARAVHHLAAGNHRAYVVLFDFLDKESLEDLIRPFMQMVDDLTPYYQDRMRPLPPTQRKIVEFLCLQGKPTTVKDISTPCLMSHQTTAKQIGELERAGFVRKLRHGRNTFCELSEPLMRICIEVKDNKTQHFRLFVEFLRHWFTTRELERRHATFRHEHHASELDRVHVSEAVRCSLADRHQPFVHALHTEAERCWDAGDYRGMATIQETLVRDGGGTDDYRRWVLALVEAGDTKSAIAVGREAAAEGHDDADLQYWLTRAYFMAGRLVEALAAIDRAITIDSDDLAHLCIRADILLGLERFEEAILDAQTLLDSDPDHWHSLQQIIRALVALDRLDSAEARARDLVRLAPDEPDALLSASSFYLRQDRPDEALGLVEKALDIDPDHERAHHVRGLALFELEDYSRASEELRNFASRHPDSEFTYCRLADSLLYANNFEEAIEIADHLIEITPEHFHAHTVRGLALIELGHPADGIAALDSLLATDDCHALLIAASRVREIGHHRSANRYLDRVAALQPESRELWVERTLLLIDEGDLDAAFACAARVETLPGGSLLGRLLAARVTAVTQPLRVALGMIGAAVEPDDFEREKPLHLEAIAEILTVSVCNFGPRYLSGGLAKLQDLFVELLDDGVIGKVLTEFLIENAENGFAGPLAEWETALDAIDSAVAKRSECRIPVEMLRAAVTYAKTGDEKRLLTLPTEQRELLEDILPSASGSKS